MAATHDSALLALADDVREMRDGTMLDSAELSQRFGSQGSSTSAPLLSHPSAL